MLRAKMTHTEKSCLRLAKVQNQCFGKTRNIIRFILAAIPFCLGYMIGLDTTIGVLYVVFACFFYYKTSFMYERDAKLAFAQTPKRFLDVAYEFKTDFIKVQSGGTEKSIGYSSLHALVLDKKYAYLFINNQQAYMLDLQTLVSKEPRELCDFLQKKSGLKWKNIVERTSLIDFLKGNREMDW